VPILVFAFPPLREIRLRFILNSTQDLNLLLQFLFFSFDQAMFQAIRPPFWAIEEKTSLTLIQNLVNLKYLDHLLFSTTNAGYFYFGRVTNFDSKFSNRYNPFLTVQQFKHSTLLEVVWATFPSVIILLILVPSILLIYSIDEDLDPEFTIKVVGHQWF